jgi:protein gp37
MTDQFGSWQIGEGWLNTVQKIIVQNNAIREAKKYPLNTFVFLTKNPQGYRYVDASLLKSANCWFGITLENFGSDEKNILRASQFAKLINMLRLQNTFISLEPLLEALIINDDVIKLLMDVQWVIFGALNIKGKPTPPQGDANVGGIIDKLLMINPKLFLKDSILKMEGMYWRTNMRDFYKNIRYVPWRV